MKTKFFYPAVVMVFVLFISWNVRARPLEAQSKNSQAAGFTKASLQGNYAITGFAGANAGAIAGVCHFDGNGHYNCRFTGNFPGEKATRDVVENINNKGDYTVNPDGTGTIHEYETVNGVTNEYHDHFVILHAEAIGSYLVATEIFGLVGQTDPTGVLYTSHFDRLPDAAIVPIPTAEPTENK